MDTTLDLFLPETLQHRIEALLAHYRLAAQKVRIIKFLLANQGAYTDEIALACAAVDPSRRIRQLNREVLRFFGLVIRGKPAPPTHLNKYGEYSPVYSWRIVRIEDE